MKERPILLNSAMVRATLDGRKTQTRRMVKPQPEWTEPATAWTFSEDGHSGPGWYAYNDDYPEEGALFCRCPYGQTGDRLWVREAFAFTDAHEPTYMGSIEYRADNKCLAVDHGPVIVDAPHNCNNRPFDGPWRPSIHMPHWASRITLEIVSVRVERLNDISEADAQSEGAPKNFSSWRDNFCALWQQINGHGSWEANPWVWAIEFKRVQP